MRGSTVIASAVVLVTVFATAGLTQESVVRSARPRESSSYDPGTPQRNSSPGVTGNDPVRRLSEKLRPFHDELVRSDRIRTAASAFGIGVVAYEVSHSHPRLPVTMLGAEALRLGLHRQLAVIRQHSGYTVEPSIGHRSFVLTCRKTFE